MVTKKKLHAVKRHQTQIHQMFLRQEKKNFKNFAENTAYNKKSLQKMNPIKNTN